VNLSIIFNKYLKLLDEEKEYQRGHAQIKFDTDTFLVGDV